MLPPLLLALQVISGSSTDSISTWGTVFSGVRNELEVAIPRIAAEIDVDGSLDEDVWRRAAILSGFSQYQPVDGVPADDATEVLVWYSADAIHFGIKAYEPHGPVNHTLADRDNIQNDDHIQLLLDTFNDGRRALVFGVNPLGVQADGIRIERGAERVSLLRPATGPVDLSRTSSMTREAKSPTTGTRSRSGSPLGASPTNRRRLRAGGLMSSAACNTPELTRPGPLLSADGLRFWPRAGRCGGCTGWTGASFST